VHCHKIWRRHVNSSITECNYTCPNPGESRIHPIKVRTLFLAFIKFALSGSLMYGAHVCTDGSSSPGSKMTWIFLGSPIAGRRLEPVSQSRIWLSVSLVLSPSMSTSARPAETQGSVVEYIDGSIQNRPFKNFKINYLLHDLATMSNSACLFGREGGWEFICNAIFMIWPNLNFKSMIATNYQHATTIWSKS